MYKIRDEHDAFAAGYLISRLEQLSSDSAMERRKASEWLLSPSKEALSFWWLCDTMDLPHEELKEIILKTSIGKLKIMVDDFKNEKKARKGDD